ncbi:Pup-ligase protein [Chthonomonas calidirosea]|uniref:Pup-ligase protein n=1 Tax=Chthonomonas calidirosea (strain DSM 23976 / ICMP 18418 / T49) TaxID=1303518 RepID=S0EZS1_CHTCT|nr:proteasome accessory factor PafA2 family protein [Chthonomonas calidirosea]CCW36024.1 Pup-ligase protein [Chthonomonas calidirosea T49]CEK17512.1 Pup-ligase protein [Chthonomonas calidirosea]CEK17513.1 Pup-ligase protein [Chthonomonas calidirosea]CEK18555.1 Pup-ligase protein [Chthonomonas calidirosea]
MEKRIFGIETEFGCMVRDPSVGTPEEIVEQVKDYAFYDRRYGLIDLHARDYAFEPARAGGFLRNGGRLYIDAVGSHEEYATPECCDLLDLVRYDRAGRILLSRLLKDLQLSPVVSFHNNSIDHFGGHTFGCHENYLVQLEDRFFTDALSSLLPFLVTRQIFAGVGRVGGHRLTRPSSKNNIMTLSEHEVDYVWVSNFYGVEIDPTVNFQLSQRADHIVKTISSRVRFNRAIINPKWDSYYSYSNLHRLHVLFGESNMSEYALMLKVGTTCLVLDLIEDGIAPPDVEVADPLETLRSVSRDPTMKWIVRLRNGRTISAIDLQRRYLDAAKRYLYRRDPQTDLVLREWETILDDLERDPLSTADRLDWAAKFVLYRQYMEETGASWQDDVMQSLDLEYHNATPEEGLFYGLEQAGLMRRLVTDEQVEEALTNPPENTRAYGRGLIVAQLLAHPGLRYVIDWDAIYIERNRQLDLKNPFHTYEKEAMRFLRGV